MARKVNFTKNESRDVKKFIIALIVVTFSIGLIYLFTGLFVTKDLKKDKTSNTDTSIDYNLTLIGNILEINRSEFYVMVYDFNAENQEEISNIISNYKSSENYKYIYSANLSDAMNNKFKSENANINVENINDLKISGLTLLHIRDKQIIDYKDNIDDIKEELEN